MTSAARQPKAARETLEGRLWVSEAECRESDDPDAFFPAAEQVGPITYAKRLCLRCTVRPACLEWALDNDMRRGIWGGLTEQERAALQRQRSEA